MNHSKTSSSSSPRPLSPHLQIYRVQLTSFMSILHRITGIGLFVGFHLWLLYLGAVGFCEKLYVGIHTLLNYTFVKGLLWIFIATFFYHGWNGLRHLMWDCGYGFSLRMTYVTGYAVWILTLVSVIGLGIWL